MSKLQPSGGNRTTCSFKPGRSSVRRPLVPRKIPESSNRPVGGMIQTTCSRRQDIAEDSREAVASWRTELWVLNIARASFEELLINYEEFLRLPKNQPDLTNLTDQEPRVLYAHRLDDTDPGVRANATICLIQQTNYLLDQQIAALETAFVKRRRLQRARKAKRGG